MCFAPQRRVLFRHLNFQKWSEHGALCTFWLRNVLRATTACTFSTSSTSKSGPENGVFCAFWLWNVLSVHFFDISTSKSGSEHGVFCTFRLRNVLRANTACNFSSLTWPDGSAPAALASLLLDPPEPQIIGKIQCFATFLPFRAPELLSSGSFFSDLLSSTLLFSLTLPISAFHLSILSEVWLLNFLRTLQIWGHLIFGHTLVFTHAESRNSCQIQLGNAMLKNMSSSLYRVIRTGLVRTAARANQQKGSFGHKFLPRVTLEIDPRVRLASLKRNCPEKGDTSTLNYPKLNLKS